MSKLNITFHGGVDSVTGANFLIETEGLKMLVDCGMYQGGEDAEERNYEVFPYNPADIDILFVTHAHADHIGRIPKLVHDGFRGKIYSTGPTMEITEIMFDDGLQITTREAKKTGREPLYEEADTKTAMSLWKEISYHNKLDIAENISVTPYDAGHILGSCMFKFSFGEKNVLFTGDLGNSPDPLLQDTEIIKDVDYLIMESVYGDRNHEEREERITKFERIIEDTISNKGTLIIPSFALERSQNLLFILNNLVESNRIPQIPVYFDSPLAIDITNVFKKNTEYMNNTVKDVLKTDKDIFDFPKLVETYTKDESKKIFGEPGPKIILASAGMSHAGRIIFHEKYYLPDPNTTILFVGYQAVGTLGRMIQDGVKNLKILGHDIKVRAKTVTIQGYSAHRDSQHLLEFVEPMADRVKKVFCVMGERKASFFLVQRLRDYLGIDAESPDAGETFEIEY